MSEIDLNNEIFGLYLQIKQKDKSVDCITL